jgi:hypothetical protein
VHWPKRLTGVLCVAVGVGLLWYAQVPVYIFHPPRPFQGKGWYNPFAQETLAWTRANFHVHSRTWGGLTNGYQLPPDLLRAYDSLGVKWIGISDYQRINSESPVPLYEHGWSIGKVHQLIFWPSRVVWTDFPFGQSVSAKQYI